MPWLYAPPDPIREVERIESTLPASIADGTAPTWKSEKQRIHAPPCEKNMTEAPLGQVSNSRPAMYLTDELYYDPSGSLVRTCISTPDKDWGRRMPHRPWSNATEPPVAMGVTHTEQLPNGPGMGQKQAPTTHGTYYEGRAEERRSESCPALLRDVARIGRDPARRPEAFALYTDRIPGKFPASQKSVPTLSCTAGHWTSRTKPESYDHKHLSAYLPPRALHHLWSGRRTADSWKLRYTGERKIWAWNTGADYMPIAQCDPGSTISNRQGPAWQCPWLNVPDGQSRNMLRDPTHMGCSGASHTRLGRIT